MKLTDKRNVLRLMAQVREILTTEVSHNASRGGMYASGLSTEGFVGGYLACLDDVDAALRHGYPSDHRGYWRQATLALSSGSKT